MKQLLSTYLFVICLTAPMLIKAQGLAKSPMPVKEGNVCYQRVVEIDEKELEDHMSSILKWMAEQGIEPAAPVSMDQDRIYVNGSGTLLALWGPNDFSELYKQVSFDLQIVVKKDRLQYTFDNFMVYDHHGAYHLEIYKMENRRELRHTVSMHRQIDAEIRKYINKLFLQMNIDSDKLISRG